MMFRTMPPRMTLVATMLLLMISLSSVARSQHITYTTRVVAEGLNVPWEIRWGYDGWIWYTERAGRFGKVHPETGERKLLLTEPRVIALTESGMLGFDFHPQFPDTPYIYIAFTHNEIEPAQLEVYRYEYRADSLVDRTKILGDMRAHFMHNGTRVLARDQYLYISLGEIDEKMLSQDTSSLRGKILRLHLDGSIPVDNPFPGNALWSLGHRNPQGLVFGRNGILYSSEHGQDTDDEINLITPASNYGWPLVEGFCDSEPELEECHAHSVTEPMHSWTPTIAISGIEYYDSWRIPQWKNSILGAALKDESLNVLQLNDSGTEVISSTRYWIQLSDINEPARRLRDICISPNGRVFVSTSNTWSQRDTVDRIFEVITLSGAVEEKPAHTNRIWVFHSSGLPVVKLLVTQPASYALAVYDVLGRERYSTSSAYHNLGEHTVRLGTAKLEPGRYFVRATESTGRVESFGLIVQ